jgi:glycosyltransferase involved in cell wall biosynthesis
MARELGLPPPGVKFLGGRDDFPAILADADALALSSDHEGVPNVVMEAMAAKLPVIATPAGGVRELVRDGTTGYVVAADDGRAMAERLRALASDAVLRRELGEAGRLRIVRDFAFDGLAEKLGALYREASAHKHGRRLRQALAA